MFLVMLSGVLTCMHQLALKGSKNMVPVYLLQLSQLLCGGRVVIWCTVEFSGGLLVPSGGMRSTIFSIPGLLGTGSSEQLLLFYSMMLFRDN